MIKVLQKRFIKTAMAAITILLVVLLGAINITNSQLVAKDIENMLNRLVKDEGIHLDKINFEDGKQPLNDDSIYGMDENTELHRKEKPWGDGNLFNPPINDDLAMSARFFLVRINNASEIVFTDINSISSVSSEDAEKYAYEVLKSGKTKGRINAFKYLIGETRDGQGKIIVFLNISSQVRSIWYVLFISIGIGIACWLVMLALVIALSKRAIKPIAENIEKQKQFVTDAGHEIKTPLAIILANTDAMELHNGETKWSKNIRTQTNRLSGLMQNLLMLSRFDEEKPDVVKSRLDLSRLVEDNVEFFSEPVAMKKISLTTAINKDIKINANREQMVQLVSILMDNAVKYCPQNGYIDVSLIESGKNILLRFKNKCNANSIVEPKKMFDRFYRGDEARTQKNGGYGIGLSVARAIVKGHGGKIEVQMNREDEILFTIKF